MSRNDPDERGRSGWLLLLVPLIATLAVGAWFGRSYFDDQATGANTLATTDAGETSSDQQPASVPGPSASAAAPAATPTVAAKPAKVDLGKVTGTYVLKGPARAPAGSVVVFVVAGPKRAVHTDSAAPYTFGFDSARMPNGSYTVGVTVIRPGQAPLSQNRLMQVANKAVVKQPAKPAPAVTKAPSAGSNAQSGSSGGSGSGSSSGGLSGESAKVLQLTNAERASAGCKPVSASTKLTAAAQAHSADMAGRDYFAHDSQDGTSPFDRIKAVGYEFRAAAENIAYGQPSASSVMDAWMNSPGHKANILNCTYTQIGIGYALRGSTPYWTQDFGTPL